MTKIACVTEKLYYSIMITLLSGAFLPLWRSMNADNMTQVTTDGDQFILYVLLLGYINSLFIEFKNISIQ